MSSLTDRPSDARAYLSSVCGKLHVADPVEKHFDPVVQRWEELHAAATVWRGAAEHVETATRDVHRRLGGIDNVWQGADADAFLAHIQQSGLASTDLADAMRAFAEVLDHTADGIHRVADSFSLTFADTADLVAEAMTQSALGADQACGTDQAREYIAALDEPARCLADAVEEMLSAFVEFCDGFGTGDGGTVNIARRVPSGTSSTTEKQENGSVAAATAPVSSEHEPTSESSVDAADASAGAVAGTGTVAGAGMVGMMPLGPMGGIPVSKGQSRRQNASRFKASPEKLFGQPEKVTPPVLGEKKKDTK